MTFHDINQGNHFVYYHLMHALMSTCDIMLFKISSIGIGAHTWMTFELHIWVILGFPFFGLEAIFWSSFDGISKIRAYFGSSFYTFFVYFFGFRLKD